MFRYGYSQKIILGLVFSCGGDALLNLDMFAYGMASFGCAQICYTLAFGFKNLRIWIAIILAIPGVTSKRIKNKLNFMEFDSFVFDRRRRNSAGYFSAKY